MLRLILSILLLGASPALVLASEAIGAPRLLQALEGILPEEGSAPERDASRLAVRLAFPVPRRSERRAARVLGVLADRLESLTEALRQEGEATPTGSLHRQLELRHLEAGDAGALLEELARQLERAAREVPEQVGVGKLRTTLALEEVLGVARSNLSSLARTLRQSREVVAAGRRVLTRMLARIEEIQDENPGRDRDRVPLSVRKGSHRSLVRGLETLRSRVERPRLGLESVRSLRKVRYLALEETLRNLASGAARPRSSVQDVVDVADRLQGALETLARSDQALARRISDLEAGRDSLPEFPPLPEWLFTRASEEAPPPSPATSPLHQEALALLDELEEELGDPGQLVEDPLTATLAERFRERHDWEQEYAPE